MTEGFSNPIIGGGGSLVYPSVHSPDYAAGSAGWTINKDGSAELNNVTVRGAFAGEDYIINSSGEFFYDGVPAAGNLSYSNATVSGIDDFGNAYLGDGPANYSVSAPFYAFLMTPTGLTAWQAASQAGPYTQQGLLEFGGSGTGWIFNVSSGLVAAEVDGAMLFEGFSGTPAASAGNAIAYADVNGFLRAILADGQVYAAGQFVNQNLGSTVNSGGGFGSIASGKVGVGTYRISGQIAYSSSVGSPTGHPLVTFTAGSATLGHARGKFASNGVPVAIDKGLTSADQFSGATLLSTEQVMEFDFTQTSTVAGTFVVQASSTGSTYQVGYANLFIQPL